MLTEWNAMMISVLAEAGAATGRDEWVAAGGAAAEFLLANLRTGERPARPGAGRWLRAWHPSAGARHFAYAADHAWLVDAFTRLAEATGQARWVAHAVATADTMLALFADEQDGGLWTVGSDAEQLIVRSKDVFDGATPSANSVAAAALLRLGALVGSARYADAARAVLRHLAGPMATHPTAFTHALAAVDLVVSGITEVAVAGRRPDLVRAVQARYLPLVVLAWGEPYPSPLWEGREDSGVDGRAYVCRQYACQAPVASATDLLDQLDAG